MRSLMKLSARIAVVGTIMVGLSGCAVTNAATSGISRLGSMGLTDSTLQSAAASKLGYLSPSEVAIERDRTEGNVTHFRATTARGAFICQAQGGGLLVGGQVGVECHPAAVQ